MTFEELATYQQQLKNIFLQDIVSNQQIYESYKHIVLANPAIDKSGALFHQWLIRNYTITIGVTLRKLCDVDPQSLTVYNFLKEIMNNAATITLEKHKAFYPEGSIPRKIGEPERVFASFSKDGQTFDPHVANADLSKLRKASGKIIQVVNREIAHHDTRKAPELKWQEVDTCIAVVREILQKYYLLFTGSSIHLDSITQEPWEWVFTQQWIKK